MNGQSVAEDFQTMFHHHTPSVVQKSYGDESKKKKTGR